MNGRNIAIAIFFGRHIVLGGGPDPLHLENADLILKCPEM
jgi:hypothetical protein